MAGPNDIPKPPAPAAAPPPPNPQLKALQDQRSQFFNARRDDASRQQVANQQGADDAISRRFAALGQTGSGAAIDAGIKAREAVMTQGNQARNEIAGQEAQLAQQEAMQGAQMAQQESQFGRTFGEQSRMFDIEQGNKLRQLDMAQEQMQLEKEAQYFNERMAELQSGHQVDLDINRGHFRTGDDYDAFLRRFIQLQETRGAAVNRGAQVMAAQEAARRAAQQAANPEPPPNPNAWV